MSKKNSEILYFEKLLDSTRLVKPASTKEIKDAKKHEAFLLKKILKETAQWTFLFGLLFKLINFIKKLKIIIITNKFISVITALSLSIVSFYGISYIINDNIKENLINSKINVKVQKDDVELLKNSPSFIKNDRIEYKPFTSTSIDKTTLNTLNSEIFKNLKAIKKDKLIDSANKAKDITKYIIFGQIEDIEKSLHIYIKIIDKESSEVIFILNKAMQKDNLVEECRAISLELSENFLKQNSSK